MKSWSKLFVCVGKIMTYLTSVRLRFVRFSRLTKKKLKWRHTVAFVFAYLPMQMRLSGVIKRAVDGTGITWNKACCVKTCVTRLSESVTLLKSTFKPQAISVRYYLWRWRARCLTSRWFRSLVVLWLIYPLSSGSKMWNLCTSFALWRMSSVSCHWDCEGEL